MEFYSQFPVCTKNELNSFSTSVRLGENTPHLILRNAPLQYLTFRIVLTKKYPLRGYILGELTHTTAWLNNAKEFMTMLNNIDQWPEMLKNTSKLLKSEKGLFVSSSGS